MGWLRRPRTTQELREWHGANAEHCEDGMIPRPRGRRRHIPTAWDDIHTGKVQRSWKRHRKTQWKPKKAKKKKKNSKFRGHLHPRVRFQQSKRTWHYSPNIGWWCTYEWIWYWEGEGKKNKKLHARIRSKRGRLFVWSDEKDDWLTPYEEVSAGGSIKGIYPHWW